MKRKITSLILALAMLLSMMPASPGWASPAM